MVRSDNQSNQNWIEMDWVGKKKGNSIQSNSIKFN